MKILSTTASLILLMSAVTADGLAAGTGQTENVMRIRIIVNGTELPASLNDTPAARDFAAMLPLEFILEDFHATEKIAYLPSPLSTDGAPDGVDPDVGDITYFAPWGNLALFYRDFGYARGLVHLGRIDGDVSVLEGKRPLEARIERVGASE